MSRARYSFSNIRSHRSGSLPKFSNRSGSIDHRIKRQAKQRRIRPRIESADSTETRKETKQTKRRTETQKETKQTKRRTKKTRKETKQTKRRTETRKETRQTKRGKFHPEVNQQIQLKTRKDTSQAKRRKISPRIESDIADSTENRIEQVEPGEDGGILSHCTSSEECQVRLCIVTTYLRVIHTVEYTRYVL